MPPNQTKHQTKQHPYTRQTSIATIGMHKTYRNKKRRRKEGEKRKCRKKKYRTYKNVENVEDSVNTQFTIVLYSTGV